MMERKGVLGWEKGYEGQISIAGGIATDWCRRVGFLSKLRLLQPFFDNGVLGKIQGILWIHLDSSIGINQALFNT